MGRFRFVALAEGVSYLILLGIAMPLKYFAGYSLAVQVTGWAHGVLFTLFCIFLIQVWIQYRWKFGKVLGAFMASLLPFGTFVLDRKLRQQYYP